jgi:hypothetical protein
VFYVVRRECCNICVSVYRMSRYPIVGDYFQRPDDCELCAAIYDKGLCGNCEVIDEKVEEKNELWSHKSCPTCKRYHFLCTRQSWHLVRRSQALRARLQWPTRLDSCSRLLGQMVARDADKQ